jgi:hypothetical protein
MAVQYDEFHLTDDDIRKIELYVNNWYLQPVIMKERAEKAGISVSAVCRDHSILVRILNGLGVDTPSRD